MPYAHGPSVKKLSKMATLLLARNYIVMMTRSMNEMRLLLADSYRRQEQAGIHIPADLATVKSDPVADFKRSLDAYIQSGMANTWSPVLLPHHPLTTIPGSLLSPTTGSHNSALRTSPTSANPPPVSRIMGLHHPSAAQSPLLSSTSKTTRTSSSITPPPHFTTAMTHLPIHHTTSKHHIPLVGHSFAPIPSIGHLRLPCPCEDCHRSAAKLT